jgi:hypothetical protein
MLAGCNAASVAGPGGNTAPVLWRGSTGRLLGYINFFPFLSLIGIRRRRSWFASWLLTVRAALLCLPEQSLAETTVKHENMFLFHFLEPPPKHPLHTIVRNGTWSFCSASDTYRIRSNARSGLRRHRLVWGIWLQSIRQIHSGIGGRRQLGPLILEMEGTLHPCSPPRMTVHASAGVLFSPHPHLQVHHCKTFCRSTRRLVSFFVANGGHRLWTGVFQGLSCGGECPDTSWLHPLSLIKQACEGEVHPHATRAKGSPTSMGLSYQSDGLIATRIGEHGALVACGKRRHTFPSRLAVQGRPTPGKTRRG